MPNIFLPRVSKSQTYTNLVADPERLRGFSESKPRLKPGFAMTPLICCLSEPLTSEALGAPCGPVCLSGRFTDLFARSYHPAPLETGHTLYFASPFLGNSEAFPGTDALTYKPSVVSHRPLLGCSMAVSLLLRLRALPSYSKTQGEF